MSPRPEPRIGDAERDAAIQALGEHFAAGRITQQEFDERADTAMRARTDAELRPLFADLPRLQGPPPVTDTRPPLTTWERMWQSVPVFPLLPVVILLVVLTKAWWLFFVFWLVVACRPRRRRWPR